MITVYRGARGATPIARDDLTWGALGDEIGAILSDPREVHADKRDMLAVGPYRLAEGKRRAAANVEEMAAMIALDLDTVADLDALLARIREVGAAALVHTSPSDPGEGNGPRKVRVFVRADREYPPAACAAARRGMAAILFETIDGSTLNADRIFFVGTLPDSPPRQVWRLDGFAADVDVVCEAGGVEPAAAPAPAPAAAAPTGDGHDLSDDAVNAIVEAAEPCAHLGQRHPLALAIAGTLRNKGISQASAAAVVGALPSDDTAARLRDVADVYRMAAPAGASALRELEGGPALLDAVDRILDPGTAAFLAHAAERAAARAEAAPARPPSLGPLILQLRGDGGSVFLDEGPDRGGYQPVALDVLPMALQEIGQGGLGVDGKRKLSPRALVERHGRIVREAVTDFAAAASHYDPERERLVMGLPQACTTAPAFDAAADAWLHALAGAKHAALAEWIAGTHRRHITRPAAALALIGQHSIGKTLLAAALARLWGALEPVPMAAVVVTFNASMATCPIVIDDECAAHKRRLISTADFRALVQSRVRHYEPKGRERRPLLGAQRFVLTANDPAQIAFADGAGSEAVAAIAERLLVIDCGDALDALHALRGADGEIDFERLCGHLAWLQATAPVPDARQRFIGADPDREAALRAALAHAATRTPEVWESLEQWLDAAAPREGGPWLCCARSLCVDPQALASTLAASGARVDLAAVRAALDPVRALDARRGKVSVRPRGDDPARRRVWALNVERVAAALGWSDEQRAAVAARVGASDEDDEG